MGYVVGYVEQSACVDATVPMRTWSSNARSDTFNVFDDALDGRNTMRVTVCSGSRLTLAHTVGDAPSTTLCLLFSSVGTTSKHALDIFASLRFYSSYLEVALLVMCQTIIKKQVEQPLHHHEGCVVTVLTETWIWDFWTPGFMYGGRVLGVNGGLNGGLQQSQLCFYAPLYSCMHRSMNGCSPHHAHTHKMGNACNAQGSTTAVLQSSIATALYMPSTTCKQQPHVLSCSIK